MVGTQIVVVFCTATVIGIVSSLLFMHYTSTPPVPPPSGPVAYDRKTSAENAYAQFLQRKHAQKATNNSKPSSTGKLVHEDAFLRNNVKVLCWSKIGNRPPKIAYETWGRRCNKMLFFAVLTHPTHPPIMDDHIIRLHSNDLNGWKGTQLILRHLHDHFRDYDWFLSADEDSFVIVENLRYYATMFNSTRPVYLGHTYKNWGTVYQTEEGVYVLSRGALDVVVGNVKSSKCGSWSSNAEGVTLAKCLLQSGVTPVDTRDRHGRERFLVYTPKDHLIQGQIMWGDQYKRYSVHETKEGPECCSDYAIAFHYIPPNQMFILDYLVYHLKPFGAST